MATANPIDLDAAHIHAAHIHAAHLRVQSTLWMHSGHSSAIVARKSMPLAVRFFVWLGIFAVGYAVGKIRSVYRLDKAYRRLDPSDQKTFKELLQKVIGS